MGNGAEKERRERGRAITYLYMYFIFQIFIEFCPGGALDDIILGKTVAMTAAYGNHFFSFRIGERTY